MHELIESAFRLHEFLATSYWNGHALEGPDPGVRLNFRLGRFVKSYLRSVAWRDTYYYLQAQAYWVLANWQLFDRTGDPRFSEIATRCAGRMLETQRTDGAWAYPNPGWKGRIATAEGTWASLGLLETYRRTADRLLLSGALRWHAFLTDEIGFERMGEELSVNYFANVRTARVPNNSAFVLRFLAEMAVADGDRGYLRLCPGLVTFMKHAQKPCGEFPYMVKGGAAGVKCWEHFQCYQYNAFQCLDLMRYYELTHDPAVPPIVRRSLAYLRTGVAEEGRVFYDCRHGRHEFAYHTAVLGAAFATAGRLGFGGNEELARLTFAYLLRRQRRDGSFPFSRGDYFVLADSRAYPRPLAMMLFHFLSGVPAREPQRMAANL